MWTLHSKYFVLSILFVILSIGHANAEDTVYTSFFSSKAVGGYDTVAYFTEKRPLKGNKHYITNYNGATWLFATQENLKKFEANPEKYAPQYGGYCAWAVSQGDTAKSDPLFWTIHKDKLYLNYDQTVQNKWQEQKEIHISRANTNWPGVLN